MSSDPTRLRDSGASSLLKSALEAGRRELPDTERGAQLEARILPFLLPPPPAPPAPPAAPPAAPAAGGAGGAAGAAASGGAGKAVALGLSLGKITAIGAAVLSLAAGSALVASSRSAEEPRGAGLVAAPSASLVVAPSPSEQLAPLSPPSEQSAPLSPPSPSTGASSKPTLGPGPSSAPPSDFAAEFTLLRSAQDALRSNPSEALHLASEHTRRFPRGTFAQEREIIAVEALVKLDRRSEAEARAERFHKAYPGSTHRARLASLLGK